MLVQEELRRCRYHRDSSRVRVLADEVRMESTPDFWYVPVSFHEDTQDLYAYYDAFSRIEQEIKEQHGLDVLLVPRMVPFITHYEKAERFGQ